MTFENTRGGKGEMKKTKKLEEKKRA